MMTSFLLDHLAPAEDVEGDKSDWPLSAPLIDAADRSTEQLLDSPATADATDAWPSGVSLRGERTS